MYYQIDWISFGSGIVATLVVFSLILPDSWAIWLGTRKNLPVVLLPLGIIAFIFGAGNLIITLGWAINQALQKTSVNQWVWWTVLIGVLIIVLFFVTKRWHKFGKKI